MITLRLDPQRTVLRFTGMAVAALLSGRTPAEVLALLPSLHALCPLAQSHAARLALAAAQGEVLTEAAQQEAAVYAEALREHGLRICLDWARLAGLPPDPVQARRFLKGEDSAALLAEAVYGCPPQDWLAQITGLPALRDWARTGATPAAHFLAVVLAGHSEPASPAGLAECYATHPLIAALQRGDAGWVATAHAARLLDLALLPGRIVALRAGTQAPVVGQGAAGEGWSRLACARGILEHRLRLVDGRIADYIILTPTLRCFGPGGAAHPLLASIDDAHAAEIALQALDPCVPYRITEGAG